MDNDWSCRHELLHLLGRVVTEVDVDDRIANPLAGDLPVDRVVRGEERPRQEVEALVVEHAGLRDPTNEPPSGHPANGDR